MAASREGKVYNNAHADFGVAHDIYEPLLHQAQRSAITPEALLTQWAVKAVQPVPEDSLLQLLGSVEGDVSDVSARHDEYLGRSLQTDTGR